MDACWSYAYYTKQVFENKADAETDPDGMKYADVVNNTEPGITGSHKTAWLLYKNIFKGSSDYMQGKSLSKYSWNNLIIYMNNSADERARWYDPEKFHAEIYGASGVGSNCFNPSGPSYCKDNGEPSSDITAKLAALGIQSVVFDLCGNVPGTSDYLSVMRQNLAELRRIYEK